MGKYKSKFTGQQIDDGIEYGVRVTQQTLSSAQQQQARENIGAQEVVTDMAKLGGGIGSCSTSSGTAMVATLTGYELVKNGMVAINFEYDVPAGATLNINSKGAKPIYNTGIILSNNLIKANDTVTFCYDGTNYEIVSIESKVEPLLTGYIILDQTSSDPTTKVLDMEGHGYTNYQRPEVVTAIRNASHRYVGTFANNKMTLKQLDDTNGTMYADGTSAASDIATQGKDVFMRLPFFFTRVSTYATDKIKIEFAYDPNQTATTTSSPDGNGWKQWGGNDLIGAYEAEAGSATNDGTGGLFSRSGVASTGNVSQANFRTKARNRGTGFTCVKWRHQNLMAILFYAYYGHTNCQLLMGSGSNDYTKNTGLKNSLGMADTTAANGNTDSINFWGLENWWGNKWEWVDNVVVNGNVWTITEDSGATRNVTGQSTYNAWVYPNKWVLGDNLDVIPVPTQDGGTDSTCYCDGVYMTGGDSRVVLRSCAGANALGGVAVASANSDSADADASCGTRLAFTGTIEIS